MDDTRTQLAKLGRVCLLCIGLITGPVVLIQFLTA